MNQKILFGIENIKEEIKNKKILLVRDASYDFLEIKKVFDHIPHVEFKDFTPNPLYQQVVQGVKVFNDNDCDTIVAIGGGSSIDVGKCIKLFCKMNPNQNYLKQERKDNDITLIAVPTTAGTGSESTKHAVIYYQDVKQSIASEFIIPNIAIIEPTVLKTLPIYQKKCTMFDALAQAIESYWSVNSNDESKEYSRKAINLIKDNWQEYIFENNSESFEKIMMAANYAGRAINITATTAAHALSYKITSLYNLPHGHAVIVCLPKVWQYMLENSHLCIDCRGEKYLQDTLKEISQLIDLDYINEMIEKLEMKNPISKNKNEEIEVLVNAVNLTRLKNNPVELSKKVIKEMYERIVL